MAAHRLGDGTEGHAFVCHRVEDRAGGGSLDGQAGQAGGVGAVHGRPAVGAVAHVSGHAPLAGDADEGGHEPVVAVAVDRRGEAQHRRADARARQGQRKQGGGRSAPGGVGPNLGTGHEPVVLGGHPTGRHPEHARGEHEGPVGVGQGRAHGLHGPPVGGRGGGEVAAEGDLVLEGQVDHAVGVRRRLGQTVRVVEVASLDDGAGRFQPLRRCLGAGQADHLVAGPQQFGHDGRADPARCAGDKYSHGGTSHVRDVSNCHQSRRDVSDCQR